MWRIRDCIDTENALERIHITDKQTTSPSATNGATGSDSMATPPARRMASVHVLYANPHISDKKVDAINTAMIAVILVDLLCRMALAVYIFHIRFTLLPW